MLLTVLELATWARTIIPATDATWAQIVVDAASDKVRVAASQPTWTRDTAPARARQIASHLAARTYLNPDSVLAEGGVGPLGGDRGIEVLSMALHLTPAELAELQALAPAGTGGGGGLWIQPVLPGSNTFESQSVFLADNLGSDWHIEYLASNDLPALG